MSVKLEESGGSADQMFLERAALAELDFKNIHCKLLTAIYTLLVPTACCNTALINSTLNWCVCHLSYSDYFQFLR